VEAVEPSLAQFDPHGKIVAISSPWVRDGRAWRRFRDRKLLTDGFVWHATSKEMNPELSDAFLERARKKDPQAFDRHYLAKFTEAVEAFLPAVAVDACTQRGREEVPPDEERAAHHGYAATLDQAYRKDSFVLAIGHREGGRVVVDRLREWAPGRAQPVSLKTLIPELKAELQRYGLRSVSGDQYAGEPFRELLSEHGLAYRVRNFTNQSKLDYYGALKAVILNEEIELLDHEKSLHELRSVESIVTPAGNVRIEAPAPLHDDYADVLAVLAWELREAPAGRTAVGRAGEPSAVDPRTREREERGFMRQQEWNRRGWREHLGEF
jgi:hypothetical protein